MIAIYYAYTMFTYSNCPFFKQELICAIHIGKIDKSQTRKPRWVHSSAAHNVVAVKVAMITLS